MFIDRKQLAEIIAQEVRARLRELTEAGDDTEGGDGSGKRKRPRKPSTADAIDSPSPRGPGPEGPRVNDDDLDDDPGPSADGPNPGQDDGSEEDDSDAIDADGDAGEDPSGAVNNEVSGKIIQAITIEPESKILPGAKEILLSFSDTTDGLRILVTATGQVKFFWRGQLHDLP